MPFRTSLERFEKKSLEEIRRDRLCGPYFNSICFLAVITDQAHLILGCGLCISTCIGRARRMIPRHDYAHGHQVPTGILLGENISK
jgi:hypothetical protein